MVCLSPMLVLVKMLLQAYKAVELIVGDKLLNGIMSLESRVRQVQPAAAPIVLTQLHAVLDLNGRDRLGH